jgi:siroheme synthase-like protein
MYQGVLIDLAGWTIRVIGGGRVALHKVKLLQRMQGNDPKPPRITIISPSLHPDLAAMVEASGAAGTTGPAGASAGPAPLPITWAQRPYQESDLDGADLVLAATGDESLNQAIQTACRDRHILCEVASGGGSSFLFASVAQQEGLAIFTSTYGKYPALSRWAREHLQADGDLTRFDGELVDQLAAYRQALLAQKPADYRDRIQAALQMDEKELEEAVQALRQAMTPTNTEGKELS